MSGVGQILKNSREAKGIAIEQVAEATSIRLLYLKAIEDEQFDIVPGEVYLKGFIRNYANYLGLNGPALVEQYKLDGSPALVFLDSEGKDTGIRIYGIPAGHEFASFIEAICLVSSGKTKTLPDKVREEIEKIDSPLEIKVFVTTTCPYCAGAVITAHEMAFVNPHITGKMIESMEFPEWAGKHNVYTVPKIIVNDKIEFEGAVPVKEYAKKVIEAHHAGEKKLIILP